MNEKERKKLKRGGKTGIGEPSKDGEGGERDKDKDKDDGATSAPRSCSQPRRLRRDSACSYLFGFGPCGPQTTHAAVTSPPRVRHPSLPASQSPFSSSPEDHPSMASEAMYQPPSSHPSRYLTLMLPLLARMPSFPSLPSYLNHSGSDLKSSHRIVIG